VRFWDSSAILPLLVREPTSEKIASILRLDPEMALWWATPVECASALARLHREGTLTSSGLGQAQKLLEHLREHAYEVQPVEEVRARAQRLLAVHRLRAADSLQLASALLWCRERPQGVRFVCLDDRLKLAALLEGFLTEPLAEEIHDRELPD
jgi:predicted nucleic acid-binding protein